MNDKNCYNLDSSMDSIMVSPIPLMNMETDQEFEDVLLEQVAKVIEVLPNLED